MFVTITQSETSSKERHLASPFSLTNQHFFPRRFSFEELAKGGVLALVMLIVGVAIILALVELACALCLSLNPRKQQRRGDFAVFNFLLCRT